MGWETLGTETAAKRGTEPTEGWKLTDFAHLASKPLLVIAAKEKVRALDNLQLPKPPQTSMRPNSKHILVRQTLLQDNRMGTLEG